MSIPAHRAFFVHVADIEHRLIGQQMQIVDQLAVFLVQFDGAGAFALLQRRLVTRQDVEQPFGALIPGRSLLLHFGNAALDRFEVFQLQLGVDDLLVADGIDAAVYVRDVVIVETAQHMNDSVRLADIGQKLIAETLAPRSPFDQPRDIDDLDGRRDRLFRIVDLYQVHDPLVGHRNHAHVRLDRAKRKIRRLRFRIRQAVEQGRFADVRQPHDSAL